MFYYGDRWFITTHRKLDAFRSRWASGESYGISFVNALRHQAVFNTKLNSALLANGGCIDDYILQKFETLLNKSYHYTFLVCNSSRNRIVCNSSDLPTMFHVGTFIDGKLDIDHDVGVLKPNRHTFNTIDEMIGYVKQINYFENPGVIVFTPERQFKITNASYLDLFELRGNQPSVKFRYLQIRMDLSRNTTFRGLYSEFVPMFDQYENDLYEISKSIHKAYMSRFINKQFVVVPAADYQVVKAAHGWFIEDRMNRKVTQKVIYDILNQQTPVFLNHMIKKLHAVDSMVIDDADM
jgi:hypothetical protein